ncbi:CRISPR-associated protein, Csn1 family [Paucilactobacillus oligofermentans DSM 15707 = LMG 22743]|uniref:CRISPR-associated endonuclease Cas9 n=1 Tax=Paucilactobacillus oligofermentans DSM 15707 = LMG 22743 TaxID=1423778 RepID=A0A0R1RFJ4_9LACO|nr:CRISPR-associated protein, Csn1 family [Paucilactobacillus oligofermentans DSM 15707 = LMG 22743]
MDDNYQLMHAKGKYGYGTRIYSEGQTAADRRGFRTTRRRLNRRKWRLRLLQDFFEPYILPQDEAFFIRQKQSNLVPQDTKKQYPESVLFDDTSDKDFYTEYPTIYHLRQALMTENRQFDIREVYLAIHHIVKYRGHFLNNAPVKTFKSGNLDLAIKFNELNEEFKSVYPDLELQFNLDQIDEIKKILLDSTKSRFDRQGEAVKLIYTVSEVKTIEKLQNKIVKQFLSGILGLNTRFDVLTNTESDDSMWKFSLDSESSDDALDEIIAQLDDPAIHVVELVNEIHSSITLAGIVPEGQGLSESMVEKYEAHKAHLQLLKAVEKLVDKKAADKLEVAYDQYINGKDSKQFIKEDFYKAVQSEIKGVAGDEVAEINQLIELDQFMPKQRTKENGAIPHQLHQHELDVIIENQSKYYDWLGEKVGNEYKLDKLVSFRVPYYVGPLVDTASKEKKDETRFAWMVRKNPESTEAITPWNFEDIVDKNASAENFIKRMTTKDKYLLNEDVLPKCSLLTQDFEVYNELNNIRVNGEKFTAEQKQLIHDELFTKHASVSIKQLKDFLVSELMYVRDNLKVEGLADEKKLMSSLSTQFDYQKIIPDQINDVKYREDIEQIIEWSTIFEDAAIFKTKLKEIDWLTDEQRNKLANKRYRGWGSLSKRLLACLVDENGQRIIDILRDSSDNFMMIVNRPEFKQAIFDENANLTETNSKKDMFEMIDNFYTSPQNKKAIRQVLLVVQDIQNAMGGVAPQKIFIEFAREDEVNGRRTNSRYSQIREMYSKVTDDVINKTVRGELEANKGSLNKEKLFLYFLQGGIDLYSGKTINIDNISSYDVDHVLPQSFIKDDSINNKVLVNAKGNRVKNDNVPMELFGAKMYPTWKRMVDTGIMSKAKFKNLTLNPDNVDKFKAEGFINRQLVETRQIIKLVAQILNDKLGDDTKIVSVKANLTHDMRVFFDFPKNRNVNNYHHAFDAYLSAFVGTYLYKRYPKLQPYFVYGEFKKMDKLKNMTSFDFLRDLKHTDKVVDKDTGEIIADKLAVITNMNKIYDFKKVLVTHEVHENSGAMYDQTLYPAKLDKSLGRKGAKQLIPKKDDMPTALYGGYTGSKDAFMSIVRLKKKDEVYYKVIGIPVRIADSVQHGKEVDVEALTQFIETKFTKENLNKKTGEITRKVEWFELVLPKVLFGQAVFDGGQPFMLGSSTYPHNLRELVLTKDSVKKIAGKESNKSYLDAYDEIMEAMNKYFPLYDTNKFREKVIEGRSKFIDLPDKDEYENNKLVQVGKSTIIDRMFIGLHANAARTDLKNIGITTPFGFMQQASGIKLTKDTVVLFQSSTGLFERKVALKDL